MKIIKFLKSRIVIPKGDYCYKIKKINKNNLQNNMPVIEMKLCPYWCWDKRYLNEEIGYCKYLKLGDKDNEGSGLLWDQVKECGIKK